MECMVFNSQNGQVQLLFCLFVYFLSKQFKHSRSLIKITPKTWLTVRIIQHVIIFFMRTLFQQHHKKWLCFVFFLKINYFFRRPLISPQVFLFCCIVCCQSDFCWIPTPLNNIISADIYHWRPISLETHLFVFLN